MPTAPVTILVDGSDRTQIIPFKENSTDTSSQLTISVTAPGIATAHMRLWDVSNSITFSDNAPVVVQDASTPGHNMFNGYVSKYRLEAYANYRIWDVDLVDLNSWLDLKIVGAPDGTYFLQDPPGTYTAIDPNAIMQANDAATVQWLFSHYAADLPVDTVTYVQQLNPGIGRPLRWSTVTLAQALDELEQLTGRAGRHWIDPDWKLHWTNVLTALPGASSGTANGPLVMLFPLGISVPATPGTLTDGVADGMTTFNYENLQVEYDYSQWADSIYVVGSTGYTFVPPSSLLVGGSGWARGIGPLGRQRITTANNSDWVGARDAIGGTALDNDNQVVIRGSATIVVNFGGWAPGQAVGLTSSQAGFVNAQFMVQKVTTEFLSGMGDRLVTLEFGTAPVGTIGLRRQAQSNLPTRNRPRRAANRMTTTVTNSKPGPGGIVRVQAQVADPSGLPWPVLHQTSTGTVGWTVQVFDTGGNDVTSSVAWSLTRTRSNTNENGVAWTDLVTDPNTNNVTYYVTASLDS